MPTLAEIWQQLGQVGNAPYLDPRVMAQGETAGEGAQYGVPIAGDIIGLGADAGMYYTDPSSRRWPNYLMSAAGLLPGIPAASQLKKAADKAKEVVTPTARRVYHGTGKEFDEFQTPAMFTTKRDYAQQLATGPTGRVIEADVTLKNPADLRALNISPSDPNFPRIAEELKAQGYDGAQYRDEAYIAFHPEQIKQIGPEAGAAPLAQIAEQAEEVTTPTALRGFGKKKEREAARARKLAAQTAAAEAGKVVEKQNGAGKRAKVEPDVYRKMYEEQGLEAVLAAGARGEHLKPAPGGGYVGAPRTVLTSRDLGAMRRGIDQQLEEGAEALRYADPERLGTWYERAKAGQAATAEPYQLPRNLEEHSVYSAGASPEIEEAFAIRHHNADVLGTGETAYRSAARKTLQSAVAENRPAKLAFKIGEYRNKNDPRIVETKPFGVNDFRWAQSHGYTTPEGDPWKAGVQGTMHPFMDMETALATQRANQKAIGGKTDWTGATEQEVPWVYGKAQDLYERGKGGRFPEGPEGMAMALREANNTMADYLPKHTASATYEYAPGANTGHRADVLEMPYEERLRYGDVGRWDQPIPETPVQTPHGTVGAGPRDVIYSGMRMRQLPTLESAGNYTNTAGVRSSEPLSIARPLVDFQNMAQTEGGLVNAINPPTLEALRFAERFRGANDAQEAVALNLPVTMQGRTGRHDVLLDRGAPPTRAELSETTNRLAEIGMAGDVTATNRGMLVLSGAGDDASKEAVKAAKARQEQVLGLMPEGVPSAREGFYEPVSAPAELAGRGIATGRVLGQAGRRTPAEAVRGVSESEAVRRVIREKIARDEGQPGTRADVQKMRDFFANQNWQPVVDLIRKGYRPAAAMAAFGYSMEGMAAEDLQEIADTRD